jgi:hypothetical protein
MGCVGQQRHKNNLKLVKTCKVSYYSATCFDFMYRLIKTGSRKLVAFPLLAKTLLCLLYSPYLKR